MKKVAVYKDRVSVQLPSRVVLYKLDSSADDMDMQYRSAAKINQKLECNLLVVTSNHILLCQVGLLCFYVSRTAGRVSVSMDKVLWLHLTCKTTC